MYMHFNSDRSARVIFVNKELLSYLNHTFANCEIQINTKYARVWSINRRNNVATWSSSWQAVCC